MKLRGLAPSLLVFLPLLPAAGCGVITLGEGSGASDPVPSGTIVANGNLSPLPGKTGTGTVSVYRVQCGGPTCDYAVRIESLSITRDTSLEIVATVNGQTLSYRPTLDVSTGTRNFTYGAVAVPATWNQIAIHASGYTIGTNNYSIATLTQVP